MSETRQINPEIRNARPEDAESIVEAFVNEYEDYYGMYVNQMELNDFIEDMEEALEDSSSPTEFRTKWTGDKDPEIVETVESEGDFIGAGALKIQGNLLELGSTIITPEYRKSRTPRANQFMMSYSKIDLIWREKW